MKRPYWSSISDERLAATAGELIGKHVAGTLQLWTDKDERWLVDFVDDIRDELLTRRAARRAERADA